MISEEFFIFSLLSVQGPRAVACSVISRAFLWFPPPFFISSLFVSLKKRKLHTKWECQTRHRDIEHYFPPQKKGTRLSCPDPASATSRNQNKQMPELPHLTNLLRAISPLPWSCAAKCAVAATAAEVCEAISIVVYLQAPGKTNVPEIAAGFEGVFPNCTGTISHREHVNRSSQAPFSQGWFTKIRCSRRGIYQAEQKWTSLLLCSQRLKN